MSVVERDKIPTSPDASESPEGWSLASAMFLCDLIRGVSYQRGEAETSPVPGLVPLLRANNIGDGSLIFEDLQYVPPQRVSEHQRLQVGDVLLAMSSGSKKVVGKAASVNVPSDAAFGAFCGVLRPVKHIDARYFGLFFQTRNYRDAISNASAGVNINNLKREYFEALDIPLPPLAEQRRIVAAVEALLARVEATRARLDRAAALVRRFRQSVLAHATTGQLTADWREEKGVSIAEHWQAETRLADICRSITDGDHLPPPKQPTGIPFLTIGNISFGRLDFTQTRFVPESYFEKIKTERRPERGSILFTVVGATIAIPVLVDTERPFCFQRHIAILKPSTKVTSEYLLLVMSSRSVYRQAWNAVTGTAQPTLPLGNLRAITTQLPPLTEQREIVRRVEALFTLADAVERRIGAARVRAERLTQAILAKAFRGELVPTEAQLAREQNRSYESAAELLARIRTNASHGEPGKKPKRRKS